MEKPDRRRLAWRIACIAGVDIRIHPTFLVLVAFVVAGWFGSPLSGAVWLGLLFGSVVAHELAHSVVAMRRGIPVRGIMLLPIGGVSEIERLPDHPRDELVVAIVGPAASFVVAAALATLTLSTGGSLLPLDLVTGSMLHRLLWANFLLGAFNLLPAFPLDGGRVYRAALAERIGLEQATRRAAALGRAAAGVMAVAGIFFDVWLVLIAVFVYFGSRAEEAATLVHLRLTGRDVGDAMVPVAGANIPQALALVHLEESDALEQAVDALTEAGAVAAVVHDRAGQVVGILRLEDVAHLVGAGLRRPGGPQ